MAINRKAPPKKPTGNTIRLSIYRPQFHTSQFTIFFLLIFAGAVSSAPQIPYSRHCNDIIMEPPKSPDSDSNSLPPGSKFLTLRNAHFDHPDKSSQKGNFLDQKSSFSLRTRKVYSTQSDGVFKIDAFLLLTDAQGLGYFGNFTRRELRLVHYRPPRIPLTPRGSMRKLGFSMTGYWDSNSGKLCMVGSGTGKLRYVNAVLKLDYPDSSTIFNSLVNGTLESFDVDDDKLNTKLLKILGVNLRNYKYELIEKEVKNNAFRVFDDMANVSLGVEDIGKTVCEYIRSAGVVELDYMSECNSMNCSFLGGGNGNSTPRVMSFNEIECSGDGRVRYLLGFGDLVYNGYQLPFEPNVTLVSEGKWNAEKKRLDMVCCRISSDSGRNSVGDCSIRLSLRFPARWTIRERSAVVGEMWSSMKVNKLGRVALANRKNKNVKVTHLKYEFTEIKNVTRLCTNRMARKVKEATYPDGQSSDMRFDMMVKNKNVKHAWGYSSPLYVDDRFYQTSVSLGREVEYSNHEKKNSGSVINVSYVLSFAAPLEFKLSREFMQVKSIEISAEGLYDSKSGHLCMVGCMQNKSPNVKAGRNSWLDCQILVEILYPSLNAKDGGVLKGTIESKREKSDPFYFDPFHIISRSIYAKEAKESIWRMDLEITMVLISNTLTCVFVCLQLFHVKRNPNSLPFISMVMLFVLSLAHMIPLLLNFEALFMVSRNSGKSLSVYFGSDGWLELNEVLVRVITMIAFLLELRLLQLAWSSRSTCENQTTSSLWISDKKVLYLSLPMYIGGGLIAWFVHLLTKSNTTPSSLAIDYVEFHQQSLWGDLKSYAGLILDGFLFPQILFNIFCDAKEKALVPWFYVGTTFVRLLPHAYDLYRSRSSTWSFNYIYANPRMDYYSTVWDIVICVGGLVFVFLIFLQQRFGGGCFLPQRYRRNSAYEKVPVVTS